jgi:hypothetical protein
LKWIKYFNVRSEIVKLFKETDIRAKLLDVVLTMIS